MKSRTENLIEIVVFPLLSSDEKRRFLYQQLSHDEKKRAARFRFDIHRDRFITGRGTIREILARRGGCSPADIGFDLNDFGKPTPARPESLRQIRFNASSSDSLGAIAISGGLPLGLDIEKIKPGLDGDYDLIVESEFTDEERDWYEKHDRSERVRVFFELWTCKEAYLKALGIGLSGSLKGFSIDLSGQNPRVSGTQLEEFERSRLTLQRLDIASEYTACLALSHEDCHIELSYW